MDDFNMKIPLIKMCFQKDGYCGSKATVAKAKKSGRRLLVSRKFEFYLISGM